VIRDAVANVKANGIIFDENRWEPEDDPATRDTVAKGRTMGCFYIESPAMRLLHQKAGSGDFDHLVIHSSIIRPAANVYIQEYLRRLHGGSWDPIHPLLADVLDETFGIMVYQEDVSRAAKALAGFPMPRPTACARSSPKRTGSASWPTSTTVSWPAPLPGVFPRTKADAVWADDDELFRLLLLQAPQRLLRPGLVPGRLSQDPSPGRIHGRGHQQPRGLLQHLCLRVRSPPHGYPVAT
jgi:hypothetical protein